MKRAQLLFLGTIILVVVMIIVGLALSGILFQSEQRLVLATTTSTYNSGLLDYILPDFERKHGVRVDVLAVGTGYAMEIARRGDADVVLAHAPILETQFVEEGYGLYRWLVMYNQFAIVGPQDDPAGVINAINATDAFRRIWQNSSTFLTRDDNSGTNMKELEIWEAADLNTDDFSSWYMRVGKGMGETLQMAEELDAYTLADEGTFFAMEDVLDIKEIFRDDTRLHNQYSVMPVNSSKCPGVNEEHARLFSEWIVSSETQTLIASYVVNGHQLFYPNAEPP